MLVVFAVNGVMISLALETFPGLTSGDAYHEGLKYNQTLAAARAQDQKGWQANVSFVPRPKDASMAQLGEEGVKHGGDFVVTLADRDGTPLSRLDVTVYLLRPTHEGEDVREPLTPKNAGVYSAALDLPSPGQWEARVLAQRGEDSFQIVRRIQVP